MKKILLAILFSIVLSQSQVGTTSANFLGIGLGARAIGMGGAYCSLNIDPSAIYWNPGAIARFDEDKFLMSNTSWLLDTDLYFSTYIKKIDSNRSIGFYWSYLDYGKDEIYTLDDQNGTGLFWDASDLVFGGTYASNLTDRFSFGAGLKYIAQNIYNESASTFALDAGLLYTSQDNSFNIGMSISNIGFDMILSGKDLYQIIDIDPDNDGNNQTIVANLNTDYFPIPIIYRMGVSAKKPITDNLKLLSSMDVVIPSDDVEHLNLGFELSYFDRAFLRCGYRKIGNSDSEQGLTLGVGTKLYVFGLDFTLNYAYQDFGVFGYIPYIDFEFNL
tara:strand:- start:252 stop:1244 length:993 start_codon:yes stop_codon:yes gene_type:complete